MYVNKEILLLKEDNIKLKKKVKENELEIDCLKMKLTKLSVKLNIDLEAKNIYQYTSSTENYKSF